jgi:hypothetical protein
MDVDPIQQRAGNALLISGHGVGCAGAISFKVTEETTGTNVKSTTTAPSNSAVIERVDRFAPTFLFQ